VLVLNAVTSLTVVLDVMILVIYIWLWTHQTHQYSYLWTIAYTS